MKKLFGILLVLLATLSAALPFPTAPAAAAAELCFPETGQCISGRFREFWEQNGGLLVFGYPITPARREHNADTGQTYLTQWFERNRFELHPEHARPYDVLLGRLGNDRLVQQGRNWFSFPKADPAVSYYFRETGHAVAEIFWNYWTTNGLEFDGRPGKSFAESLALFGMPLSEPAYETNSSGDTVLTQWFERARFEYHPHNQDPYKVLLGLLGNEVFVNIREPEIDPCAAVPDPVSASIRPGKCVAQGTVIEMDISGFQSNEDIGYWLTAPDDSIHGSVQTINIGPTGSRQGIEWSTTDSEPGLWYWVFRGTSSGHEAIVYFQILPRNPPAQSCENTPDPISAHLDSQKCLELGQTLQFDVFGFEPNEDIGLWLTNPYGEVALGTRETVMVGADGRLDNLRLPTGSLYEGMWYWVFEGVSSRHQAIVYFYVDEQ